MPFTQENCLSILEQFKQLQLRAQDVASLLGYPCDHVYLTEDMGEFYTEETPTEECFGISWDTYFHCETTRHRKKIPLRYLWMEDAEILSAELTLSEEKARLAKVERIRLAQVEVDIATHWASIAQKAAHENLERAINTLKGESL